MVDKRFDYFFANHKISLSAGGLVKLRRIKFLANNTVMPDCVGGLRLCILFSHTADLEMNSGRILWFELWSG